MSDGDVNVDLVRGVQAGGRTGLPTSSPTARRGLARAPEGAPPSERRARTAEGVGAGAPPCRTPQTSSVASWGFSEVSLLESDLRRGGYRCPALPELTCIRRVES